MLKQIVILTILIIVILCGCAERKEGSILGCEGIKNEQKRDDCLAELVESSATNDTAQNLEVCSKIVGAELRDLCLFKVVQDSWRGMMADNLRSLCRNISNAPLKQSCNDITNRPHLQAIR